MPGTYYARAMPEHIRRPGEQRPDDDVVTQLERCHERIREFSSIANRLPPGPTATPAELGEAAAAVVRYFTVALPRHERDEEDSLAPALVAAAAPAEIIDALGRMRDEHRAIDECLAEAGPLWTGLAADPARRDELGPQLAAVAERLRSLFEIHLPAEEKLIFPAVAALPAPVLASIRAEMRQRRDK